MDFGVITSISIGVNLETGANVRLAKVNAVGDDTVTVELPFPAGDEYVPAVGDTVYYSEVDAGWLVGHYIQCELEVDDTLSSGERELFSLLGSSRRAKVRLNTDGEVILNDGTDYAIKFEELESAINVMIDTLNDFVDNFNNHAHVPSGPGLITGKPVALPPSSPTVIVQSDVSIDMSKSKVEKVRL